MKNKKSNLKKDFIWNILGSTIHAFNSLFFLIIVTRVNGVEVAGYFSYGFTISNIFLTVASFGGRGYQVTDAKNEFNSNKYKNFRYFTTILTLVLSVMFFLLFKYPIHKYLTIILLIIVRAFESISDVYFGILQKNNELYKVGKSLFYKNLLSLIVFIGIELIFKKLLVSIICWSVVNLLFLVFMDIKNVNKKDSKKEKFKLEIDFKEIFKKTFFFFTFNFISIFVLNIPRYFIDFYLTDELQGIYGILTMPATMVVLLSSFILTPYATRLAKIKDISKFKLNINKIFKYIIFISLICIFLAYTLGIPVLNLIYGLNLSEYKIHLTVVMIGAAFYSINSLLGLIFIIRRKTKYQFIIYLITLAFSCICSYFLITNFNFWGGIISYALIMFTIFIFYMLKYKKTINNL